MVPLTESSGNPAASAEAAAASPAGPDEAELLAGTVTFLLTDIEGSTRLWEAVPEAMEVALERHNRLLTGVIEDHGGVVVTSRGGVAGRCRAAGADGAAYRRGAGSGERAGRPRADQPVRPGEGRRARRAG